MTWDDERYYLIAFYEKYNNISNFRVDRMESIEILDESVVPKPENFNIAEYMNSTFSMFSRELQEVKLRFRNDLDYHKKMKHLVHESTYKYNLNTGNPSFWHHQFDKKMSVEEVFQYIENHDKSTLKKFFILEGDKFEKQK